MDDKTLNYYKTISKVTNAINKAETLDEALKEGLKLILNSSGADNAIIYHINDEGELRPYFWICPMDLTSVSYKIGEGFIGETYKSKEVKTILNYDREKDNQTKHELDGLNISSLAAVSFSDNSYSLGCIEFIKISGNFSDEDLDLCQIMTMFAEMTLEDKTEEFISFKKKEVIMSVNNIHKSFKNGEFTSHVLKGVNFNVYKGEFLCFLGESGCGKSTILNIIGGLLTSDEGSFTFDGKEFKNPTQKELTEYRKDNIGFIFQSYNLMPNLNAKQNLDLIAELVDDPMDSLEALALVGLKEKQNSYPSELSGGQQQRISIARALVKKPKLIMADEPTAALDYTTSIEVLSALEGIVKSGATLIMVTHNEEITKMADRIIRFRNGQTYEVTINPHPKKATDLVW